MYEQAQKVGRVRSRSRTGSEANKHPQTRHTYLLRSFVYCELCERRMCGQTETRRKVGPYAYFACQPSINHRGREDRFPDHPKVVRVREDTLIQAVHDLFQRRIFGPQRRELLAADLPESSGKAEAEWEGRRKALNRSIADLVKKQDRLIAQIEDNDASPAFSRRPQTRFTELETERRAKADELAQTEANPPARDHQVNLLDKLPLLQTRLAELPEPLQRKLFAAFHLEIRYDDRVHVALIRVTLDAETIEGVATMTQLIPNNENSRPLVADGCAEHLLRAPGEGPTTTEGFQSSSGQGSLIRAGSGKPRQVTVEVVRRLPQRKVRAARPSVGR